MEGDTYLYPSHFEIEGFFKSLNNAIAVKEPHHILTAGFLLAV